MDPPLHQGPLYRDCQADTGHRHLVLRCSPLPGYRAQQLAHSSVPHLALADIDLLKHTGNKDYLLGLLWQTTAPKPHNPDLFHGPGNAFCQFDIASSPFADLCALFCERHSELYKTTLERLSRRDHSPNHPDTFFPSRTSQGRCLALLPLQVASGHSPSQAEFLWFRTGIFSHPCSSETTSCHHSHGKRTV